MRLIVLGSSGTYPVPGRPASGYLVEHENTRVWMDAGPGTFMALADRVDPGSLDAVVISHIHIDHCSDLFALYHHLSFGPGGRVPVPVFVPADAAASLASFVRADDDSPFYSALHLTTVGDGDGATVGAFDIRFAAADHSVPANCTRIEVNGKVLVYSGDTGTGGGIRSLAEEADVLLCEATYQGAAEDKSFTLHLTAAEAGELARAAGARRLILTHLAPTLDPVRSLAEAEGAFGKPVLLAVPGMEVSV